MEDQALVEAAREQGSDLKRHLDDSGKLLIPNTTKERTVPEDREQKISQARMPRGGAHAHQGSPGSPEGASQGPSQVGSPPPGGPAPSGHSSGGQLVWPDLRHERGTRWPWARSRDRDHGGLVIGEIVWTFQQGRRWGKPLRGAGGQDQPLVPRWSRAAGA